MPAAMRDTWQAAMPTRWDTAPTPTPAGTRTLALKATPRVNNSQSEADRRGDCEFATPKALLGFRSR